MMRLNRDCGVPVVLPADRIFINRLNAADRDKTAIIDLNFDPPLVLDYGEFLRLTERTAQGLLDRGVVAGENVAYLLPNGWEFVVLTAAILGIGAVACPMLPALREREITFITNRSKSCVLIVPDQFHGFSYPPMIDNLRTAIPRLEHVVVVTTSFPSDTAHALGGLISKKPKPGSRPAIDPNAIAQLMFTSGTTGEPKGVLHSHATLSYALHSHVRTLELTEQDVIWVPSPMAHQTGFLYGMMLALYLGAAQICQSTWNIEDAKRAIEKHGATFVQAAMPFLADLVRTAHPLQGLKIFVATGAAVPRQLACDAGNRLNCKVIGGWGSTEACLVTVGSPLDKQGENWKSDGRPIEGMRVKVTDGAGRELAAGKEGAFWVETPAMFVGYLDHPDWYQDAFDDNGFFATGDLALIDDEGFVYITGRQKDVINRGGEKIPAAELEDLLYQFEKVRDVAVVGMPDPRLGERICAYIVPGNFQDPPPKGEITNFLKERGVTKIYWPEHVEWIDKLPMTPSGKVQKYLLRQMIARRVREPGFCLGVSGFMVTQSAKAHDEPALK
jgi:cyclohexanecarboxylate-CoA ligase